MSRVSSLAVPLARPLLLLLLAVGIAGAVLSIGHLDWFQASTATAGATPMSPH